MNRPAKEQSDHDKAVEIIAKHFSGAGYIVEADISGWTYPITINDKIPDVIAKKLKNPLGQFPVEEVIIIEIETESSKNLAHAKEQKRAFSSYEDARPNVEFRLIVI